MRNFHLKFKIIFFSLVFGILSLGITVAQVAAQQTPELIYDTSSAYTGACGHTDKTTWTLDSDLPVSLFQIWYDWATDEKEVSVTLNKDGTEFFSERVIRTTCDTYQKNWCNGDLEVDRVFPKGVYELKVEKAQQCSIPSGNGVVRLYGVQTATPTPEPSPTLPPAVTSKPTVTTTPAESKGATCFPQWVVYLTGVSVILNVVFSFLFLQKKR